MRKILLSFVMMIGLFGASALAQHRGHFPIYRPDYRPIERTHNIFYQHSRPVLVEVYVDEYGNVISTNSMLSRNREYGDAYRREAEQQARMRRYKATGRPHRKTISVYFRF